MTYIRGLDGLRAIAIGTVFFGHAFTNIAANAVGVDLFFALSGFLITRGLRDELEQRGEIGLRPFYLRRALRLAPALLLMVACVQAIEICDGYTRFRSSIAALTFTMNWGRAFDFGVDGVLGNTWSLAVEEQFYVLWPLLLGVTYKIGGRDAALKSAIALAALSLGWRIYLLHSGLGIDRIYNGFDTHADGLLIGCALALCPTPPAARFWPLPLAMILGVFLFLPWMAFATLPATIIAICGAWLICVCWSGSSRALINCLEFGPIRYIGRISYGLYLWHWPILMMLWSRGYSHDMPGTACLDALLTLCCAAASFHFVERPILRRKGRIRTDSRRAAIITVACPSRTRHPKTPNSHRTVSDRAYRHERL